MGSQNYDSRGSNENDEGSASEGNEGTVEIEGDEVNY